MSAPASVVLSLVVIPMTGIGHDVSPQAIKLQLHYKSLMDAISTGTIQGLKLLANVVAMLIVLVALVALANGVLSLIPMPDAAPLTLQRTVGWVMQPVAWSLGVDWVDTQAAGQLLGTKLVLNEFIAYLDFSHLSIDAMNDKSRILMTYLLCGFANFGSLGIVIAGLGAMAPTRREEIVSLGPRALLVGTLATFLSSANAALILFV